MKYWIFLTVIIVILGIFYMTTSSGIINPFSFGSTYNLKSAESLPESGKTKVEMLKDKPEVRLKKWNGEVDLGISYEKVKAEADKSIFSNKVIWKDRKNPKEEVHAYPVQARAGLEDGGFEIEVVLNEKPSANKFDFAIDGAEELDFLYQPPLNEEYPNRGCSETECVYENHTTRRAVNVVGSYAVYHKTKKDHIEGQINYSTGKVYHIYRPKAIDANGKEQWAELNYSNGVLSVTVPQEFLDSAVYPVVVDPTFGYTTAGATYDCGVTSDNYYLQLNENSPAGTNTMNNITIYGSSCTSGTAKFGLYSQSGDAPNSRLAYDASAFTYTADQWNTNTVNYNYSLTASTQYWVALENVTGGLGVAWDTGGTKDIEYSNDDTLPATASPISEIVTTAKPSAYVTYTATAAASPHIKIRGGGATTNPPVKIRGGSGSVKFR